MPDHSDTAPVLHDPVLVDLPELSTALTLHVHGEEDEFVSRALRDHGVWEPFETQLTLACLAPGNTFVDVGANLGYFTILAAARVGPQGHVVAVEPDPRNCELLRRSVQANQQQGTVELVEAALSSSSGEGTLFLSENNLGDHQIFGAGGTRASCPIRLIEGAPFLEPRVERIDLVKIDTQGSEFEVVSGMMPLLQALPARPRMLIELTPFSLRAAGASGSDLVALLGTLRLPFWIVDHIEHELVATTETELRRWCDNVDSVPGDEGFMNIFLGDNPFART